MDSTLLTYLMMAFVGISYYLLYRVLAHKILKWKMIHSIWLPLLYTIGFSGFGLSLLSTPWFGTNRTPLSIAGVFVELNFPVIVFFLCFIGMALIDRKNVVKK